MKTNLDRNRRQFLLTSAGGAAAAGLAGFAPAAFAQGKPLPPVATKSGWLQLRDGCAEFQDVVFPPERS